MKAIIFLAGIGNRIKSVTHDPKCLIEIGGKLLIFHYLYKLNDLGINEVVFVVGYKKEKIKKRIGHSYKNTQIKYIENNDYLKGSILSLLYARDEFNDDIITMDGDVIFDIKILQNLINSENKNSFLVDFHCLDLVDGMKVVTNRQGVVKDVNRQERIQKQKENVIGEGVGFIKWSKENAGIINKAFKYLLHRGIDDDDYEKAVRYLINNDICQFGVTPTENRPWIFINTPEDLKKASKYYSHI